MINYTKFRIEAQNDHTSFKVFVKGFFVWKSGYVNTNYFNISYASHSDAVDAVNGYKTRLTDIED